jgi:NAD(P)-dependent dehydrogenase (short-subunit alcohol dehydrogenase family)
VPQRHGPTHGAVLVTGASTGIGHACSHHLAGLGYHVFAGVRRREDGDTLRDAVPGRITPIILDVTRPEQIAAAVEEIDHATGAAGLAGLVNNAGVAVVGPLALVGVERIRRQLEVNVIGQVAVTQAFLPMIRAARGRVANM